MSSSASTALGPLLTRLWDHVPRRRRRQGFALVVLMLISAGAETLTLGAVLPFLGVLIAPQRIFDHPAVAPLARALDIHTAEGLALPLTAAFVISAVAAGLVRLFVLWATNRYCFGVGIDLSIEMYRRTLHQPYLVHLARNTSDVVSGLTAKTSTVVLGILSPLLTLFSSVAVLALIVLLLLVVDAPVAVWSAAGFGLSYAAVTALSKRRLEANSRRIAMAQTELIKVLQEGLGGIRDVLLDGTQPLYCDIYQKADTSLRVAQSSNTFISVSPRPAMEALGLAIMALIAYFTISRSGDAATTLPVLGALALGAQRLIPAFQQSYASWSTIVGSAASLRDTLEILDQPLPASASEASPPPLTFREIRFSHVSFRYGPEAPWALEDVSFSIARGARVGVVGPTGSGKSTVVDLLMALLEPSHGDVLVDDVPLSGRRTRAWQRGIAHVPQSVYLADATVAQNIAFGVPVQAIDMDRVKAAARRAQIADFFEQGPDGYAAMVGERGVRLSGGQRQRIGLARAFYKEASLLILDEATSALDTVTERSVMAALDAIGRDITVVIIAHRLSTIQGCDTIIEIRNGRIAAQGQYDHLLSHSDTFAAMAAAQRKAGS